MIGIVEKGLAYLEGALTPDQRMMAAGFASLSLAAVAVNACAKMMRHAGEGQLILVSGYVAEDWLTASEATGVKEEIRKAHDVMRESGPQSVAESPGPKASLLIAEPTATKPEAIEKPPGIHHDRIMMGLHNLVADADSIESMTGEDCANISRLFGFAYVIWQACADIKPAQADVLIPYDEPDCLDAVDLAGRVAGAVLTDSEKTRKACKAEGIPCMDRRTLKAMALGI